MVCVLDQDGVLLGLSHPLHVDPARPHGLPQTLRGLTHTHADTETQPNIIFSFLHGFFVLRFVFNVLVFYIEFLTSYEYFKLLLPGRQLMSLIFTIIDVWGYIQVGLIA